MDAYDIQDRIRKAWSELCRPASGTSVKKNWPKVPVHVLVDGELREVKEVYVDSSKIILRASNEQSTI